MELSVIGISHRTAPVEVREKLALPGELARRLLRAVHAEKTLDELVVADTCNRTEFYFVARGPGDPLDYLLAKLSDLKGQPVDVDRALFYRRSGDEAVAHLFRVAAGMDSQIVGEHEILAQLKTCYRLALEERTARFLLNKLLHAAFRVSKRVRTETQLGYGSTSVAQAAAELAFQVFTDLAEKTVLLVGAGKTVEAAARALIRPGVGTVIVANRTLARAQELAAELAAGRCGGPLEPDEEDQISCPALLRLLASRGLHAGRVPPPPARPAAEAVELADIPAVIGRADVVLCSTGSPEAVLTRETVGEALRRRNRLLLIVDIAVPRDVDPRVGELPNVFLHNINDLDKVVEATLDRRRQEIPKAQAIIDLELQRLARWRDSLDATATIRQLRECLHRLRKEQFDRYGRKLPPDAQAPLEAFSEGLVNKVLHQPIAFLRTLSEQASASDQLQAVDVIRRMFGLDETGEDQ